MNAPGHTLPMPDDAIRELVRALARRRARLDHAADMARLERPGETTQQAEAAE